MTYSHENDWLIRAIEFYHSMHICKSFILDKQRYSLYAQQGDFSELLKRHLNIYKAW